MSVIRNHGLISFECDECREVFDPETRLWTSARTQVKEEGWRAIPKTDGDWIHFCKDCK